MKKDQRIEKAADVFASLAEILFAGAQLSKACESGVVAYGEFKKELEKRQKAMEKELEAGTWYEN